jgi:hypothetical protein
MNRCVLAVLACLAFAGAGKAQVFFLDEFDGDDLGPHWRQPSSDRWAYNVSGGQLNVTGLFYPSNPKTCCNHTAIGTVFVGPPADFRVRARMGWDAGTLQGLSIFLAGEGRSLVEFGYDTWSAMPDGIFAHNNIQFLRASPPAPGMYEFAIERRGSLYEFSLDRVTLGTLEGDTTPLDFIGLSFWGPAREPFGAFHIDRIEVVPVPSGLAAFGVLAALGSGVRRPRRPNHGWGTHCGPPSRTPRRGAV